MKIAVIGASSFSGKAFCRVAREHGHEVTALSRPDYDLRDAGGIVDAVMDSHSQHVVNFAALNMVGESWLHYADYYQTNIIWVAEVCDGLRADGISKFVQVSTPEVYGNTPVPVMENDNFRPSTPYAISRAAADQHLRAINKTYGFPVCWTRTVNVYGEGQQLYRIIPKTVLSILRGQKLKLHGGGVSERSFIHIDDVAAGILRVLDAGIVGTTYHMATQTTVTIRRLVEMICDIMHVQFADAVEIDYERPGKDMLYLLNDYKIRATLGWSDKIKLEDALPNVVHWFVAREHEGEHAGKSLEYAHVA
jgi:dTDP-glucose 4,6-dehydratase